MRTLFQSSRTLALGLSLYAGLTNGQASLPAPRWGQATTVIGTTVLVHGGKLDQNNSFSYTSAPNTAQLLSLDLSSGFGVDNPPWSDVDAPNGPALAFHTITAFAPQQFLFFGGDPGPALPLSTRNDSAGTLWYAGHRGTWTTHPDGWAEQPMRRQYHSANSFQGRVFITGGEKVDDSDFAFRDPYVFNPWVSGSQFSALSSDGSPPDLVGQSTISHPNGTLFVLGGYSRSTQQLQPLNVVYTYNIADGKWSSFNTNGDVVPGGRRNFAAVLVGVDTVLIHGGADGSFQEGRSDGFLFNLNSRTWTSLPALDQALGARWDHASFSIGNNVFFTYGYTSNGPASNTLLLYDVPSGSFQGSYTPPGGQPNTNSPIIYPDNGGGGGGGGNTPAPPSTGNNGQGGQNTPSGDTGNSGNSGSTPHGGESGNDSKGSTPIVLGSIFGGLAAAAIVVVIIVVYRRRLIKNQRRGWSGTSDDAEKLVVVGGFQRVPRGKGYGLVTRILNVRPTSVYTQAPGRERYDILGDEINSNYRRESRARGYRTGTGDTGGSYGTANLGRWGSLGNAPSAIGSLVNASVSSFRTVLRLNNPPPAPAADLKVDSYNSTSRNLNAPPSAWRRGSSYQSNHHTDPFGDEHGVEEEYQRAMDLQHEALKRAPSSGVDEYSELILNRSPSEGLGGSIAESSRPSNMAFIPLAPVLSISTDPSQSHGSEDHHERHKTSTTTHGTTVHTPFADSSLRSGSPRIQSPTQAYQLQRATSAGTRIGASLTRAISVVSTLFSGGHEHQSPRQRNKSLVGGAGPTPYQYDYEGLRDPNPPPPMLGMNLVPINESRTEDASRHASRLMSSSEGGIGAGNTARPPLVLKALHGKSLSSLRTANSDALERLGTGNWNVIQRDGTGSSRRTDGSLSSVPDSQYTDLVGYGGGDADSASFKWQDFVGREETRAVVESPVDLAVQSGFFNEHPPLAPLAGPSSPTGPRPIPPPKHVSYSLAQRMETLGGGIDNVPSSPTARHQEPTSPRRAVYGLAPKPTLFIANPGKRGATDSS